MTDIKTTNGMFAALRRGRREQDENLQAFGEQLCEHIRNVEYDLRQDVINTHAAVDRLSDEVSKYTAVEYKLNKLAAIIGSTVIGGIIGATGFAAYEASATRTDLRATRQELTRLRSDLTDGIDPDLMGKYGLPARIECIQVSDGKGGIDVRFSASRTPLPGSGNGTITTSKGTLYADGRIEGKTVTGDGTELPSWPLRPMAELCRRALNLVPGVAG